MLTPGTIQSAEDDSLRIFITGSFRGRIGGCVCPGGGYGGLDRRQTLLTNRYNNVDYFSLDCGGFQDLDPDGGKQASLCTILGLKKMGLKAVFVGMRDLFYGEKFLRSLSDSAGVPLISANLIDNKTGITRFLPWFEIEFSDKILAITGFAEHLSERRFPGPGNINTVAPDSVLNKIRQTIPEKADVVIMLTDMSESNLQSFLPLFSELDIVFTSSRKIDSISPFEIAGITVVKPMRDGGSLDGVVISSPSNGEIQTRVIKEVLKERVKPDPGTKKWLNECLSGR